ncbi:ribokinase [Mannheimia bovis]|uniref:ribokinase n=1 Tax=Mannheimia bovis TaxID=2770636 RepID=UPI0024B8261A|nr:ribokinase [Mannheimia bovis]WHP47907.1 ribokinase [Mannheimia bovis]
MKNVVVVGSLHYDIVVETSHRPIKGETVLGQKWYPKFGGKGGNQAVAAAKAGCSVRMVSAVGDDDFSTFLLHKLQEERIDLRFIQRIKNVGSGMSVAIMDLEGDYGAVVVSGANLLIDTSKLAQDELWHNVGMLILQNEVPEQINIAAAQQAALRQIPVCINAAPAKQLSEELTSLIDILIVNAIEAEGMCNIAVPDLESAKNAAEKLSEEYKKVVVTAGGSGVAFADGNNSGTIAAQKVKVVSTLGAGDCFVGHLCGALIQGKLLEEAVEIANTKAAEHVSALIR